ncbi:MAG: hypothetical protein HYV20_12535 [Gemmatimonadetes bacterium]|nr:hypothetical protein [Gemmatimonadota bacterium]
MKPYDRVTLIRNRYRARDLRIFRARVEAYFEQVVDDGEGLPVDWHGVRAARAQINRMLPRVVQIVQAADLGASTAASTRNPADRSLEILHNLFSAPYAEGGHQEVLDVLDMAIGVYDANQLGALVRTVNPFYYLMNALGFLAGLPRRALVAIGLMRPRPARDRPDKLTGFDAALARLAGMEQLMETRFAEMREWQSRVFADNANQITDLAERMDFLERVLAQQRPAQQLSPGEKKVVTPH